MGKCPNSCEGQGPGGCTHSDGNSLVPDAEMEPDLLM